MKNYWHNMLQFHLILVTLSVFIYSIHLEAKIKEIVFYHADRVLKDIAHVDYYVRFKPRVY